ncbi:NAD-dependent epimerase/dehydratase family protein [Pseudomonas fluorescens]|uniref:NAD-dependent epimerase/dehydratase family protein n=1 Tax=Pseudomonas fluorescens TaxID=294 RepID=UPI000CA0E8CD|nr:hypothetical protein C0J56_08655 [Pseudomonas fluorescens]
MDERRVVSAPISYLKDVVLVNVLVTGDAGFIGPAVICYVISPAADSVTEVSQRSRYAFDRVGICDRDHIPCEQQPDTIPHFAGSYVDRSISGPTVFLQANSMGTYTLLEATRHCWAALGDTRKDGCGFQHIFTEKRSGAETISRVAWLDHTCAVIRGA